MATYAELYTLSTEDSFKQLIAVCLMVGAQTFLDAPDADSTIARKNRLWARETLRNPTAEAEKAWNYILAKSKADSDAVIRAVTDANAQSVVDGIIPELVLALAGE